MTVADVAIEPEKRDKNAAATPRGTLPIIPPDPVHMAIQGVAKFNDDTGGQDKRDKEYEVWIKNFFEVDVLGEVMFMPTFFEGPYFNDAPSVFFQIVGKD